MENLGEVILKGAFKRMTFSSAKKYSCEKGDLTLTSEGLTIKCENRWSKLLPYSLFEFLVHDKTLEVRDKWGKYRFTFLIDKSDEWKKAIQTLSTLHMVRIAEIDEKELKRPSELKEIFDMKPEVIRRLYKRITRMRQEYMSKNIRFSLHVYAKSHRIKDRKVQAFIVAHSYVAWYEWLKSLLYEIHKAKFGRGPKDDNEMMTFLDNYPSWKFLMDTSRWGMKPNQMRNCITHARFYFDYTTAELVFITRKEKRVRFRDLAMRVFPMANFYSSLISYLHSAETL